MNYNIIGSTVGIGILALVAVPVIGMAAALIMIASAGVFAILFRYSRSGRQKDPIYDQEPVAYDPNWVQPETMDSEDFALTQALADEEGWNFTRASALMVPNRYGDIPLHTFDEIHLKQLHRLNYFLNKLAEREDVDEDLADRVFCAALSFLTLEYLERDSKEHYEAWGTICVRAFAYHNGKALSPEHTMKIFLLIQDGDIKELARVSYLATIPEEQREVELAKMELQNVRVSNRTRDTIRIVQGVHSPH